MNYRSQIIQDDMERMFHQIESKEKLYNTTVLITGASGMLATYMTYYLMYLNEKDNANIHVLALVRNEEKAWKKFANFRNEEQFDLLVQDVCEPIKYTGKIDYIVHTAGNASPHFIMNDPVGIIKANTLGTINILETARKAETKRVLYASTREVYGKENADVTEIKENIFGALDPMERRSCYPESKRISESIVQSYYYQYGIESVVVRIAHSYGPGMIIDNDGRVMADFISDIVHGRDIVLKSKGDAVRAFCYVTDAVAAMFIALLEGEPAEAYNIANETEPYPIRKVAEKLVQLYPEKGLKVVFDIPKEMSLGYSKMGRVMLNTEKIENKGWKVLVNLESGLKKTIDSFEEKL